MQSIEIVHVFPHFLPEPPMVAGATPPILHARHPVNLNAICGTVPVGYDTEAIEAAHNDEPVLICLWCEQVRNRGLN